MAASSSCTAGGVATGGPKIFGFFQLCGRLKHLLRTGWVRKGVKEPEDVAGHMYRMALMAFLFTPSCRTSGQPSVDRERCIKMVLVHDLAECIVGDITPSDGIDKEKKHQMELDAMHHICSLVPQEVSTELMDLWREYEDGSTPEARLVKDLDKFDMIFQAYEYEKAENTPGKLEEFFTSTKGRFTDPVVKQWVSELEEMRKQNLSIGAHEPPTNTTAS